MLSARSLALCVVIFASHESSLLKKMKNGNRRRRRLINEIQHWKEAYTHQRSWQANKDMVTMKKTTTIPK